MTVFYAVIAVIAGVLNTIEAGSKTALSKALEQSILAALIVTVANVVIYLTAAPFVGLSVPSPAKVALVPWWGWLGGALGGFYVLSMIFLANKLGAATFTGITVTAAIVTSVALDHFALVGFAQHPAGPLRIIECLLMICGVAFVSLS